MNDEDQEVSQSAIDGLVKIFTLLENPALVEICENYSPGSNYDYFLDQVITPLLEAYGQQRMRSYVDAAMSYFNSPWPVCKANSAYLTGGLIKYSSEQSRKRISASVVSSGLIGLLQDSSAQVRAKACKALSLLTSA